MSEWNNLINPLADAFLAWKYGTPTCNEEAGPGEPSPPNAEELISTEPTQRATSADTQLPPTAEIRCTVNVYNIFSMELIITILRPPTSTSIPVNLATHGYLAKTPTSPTVAIGFQTLEHFHRLRLRQPSLSIEAFTKVICDHYQARRPRLTRK